MQPTLLSIYKYKYILILFISNLYYFNIYSQTTAIPDSNFEAVLVNLNIDTNGVNGNILNSDAEFVSILNLSEESIQNLSGIEAFINLKTLDCSMNNLSSLNISQNTQLEVLYANDNNINSINVLSNTELVHLNLSSNQLFTIDVTNNPYLESLSVDLNNLNSLDLSSNLQLEYLGGYSNNLSSIDLSNNAFLKHIYLDFNDLNELDVTQNTTILTLSCSSNNISELNLNLNTDLNYFDCRDNNINALDLSNNIDLKRLFISNNNVTELDISNHPNLLLFYARYNNISSLDISNNQVLRWIKCEGNNLSTVDFRNGNNTNIAEFVMTENSNLSCIYVDDSTASYLETWLIDDSSAFVENESDCEALSVVEEAFDSGFKMYPNPALETVSISIDSQKASFEIYTINGQLMFNQTLTFGENNIQLNTLSSGMYLVKLTSENLNETIKLLIN